MPTKIGRRAVCTFYYCAYERQCKRSVKHLSNAIAKQLKMILTMLDVLGFQIPKESLIASGYIS